LDVYYVVLLSSATFRGVEAPPLLVLEASTISQPLTAVCIVLLLLLLLLLLCRAAPGGAAAGVSVLAQLYGATRIEARLARYLQVGGSDCFVKRSCFA
jgi:hypothetical protein